MGRTVELMMRTRTVGARRADLPWDRTRPKMWEEKTRGEDDLDSMLNSYQSSNLPGKTAVSHCPNEETGSEMLRKVPDTIQSHEVKTVRFELGFVWLQNLYSFHDGNTKEKREKLFG